jgi:hypothetical protein
LIAAAARKRQSEDGIEEYGSHGLSPEVLLDLGKLKLNLS